MMDQLSNALAASDPSSTLSLLKDVVPPQMASWWPFAWGWWVLIGLALSLVIGLLFALWFYKRQLAIKKEALWELSRISNSQLMSAVSKISAYDQLLRRVLLSYFPREKVASLTGDDWFVFLDKFLLESDRGFVALQSVWTQALYQSRLDPSHEEAVVQRCYAQTAIWLQKVLPLSKQARMIVSYD